MRNHKLFFNFNFLNLAPATIYFLTIFSKSISSNFYKVSFLLKFLNSKRKFLCILNFLTLSKLLVKSIFNLVTLSSFNLLPLNLKWFLLIVLNRLNLNLLWLFYDFCYINNFFLNSWFNLRNIKLCFSNIKEI